ncbi:hypothetical protein [Streptacidiphilus carbonis]|uniref:hypothetical protein n=1 Tax=Streptacidiphilus carbonis TaxID=105422 RepID=UPI000A5D41D5|nr:hypothetical protein [Streptacidiphilus carbonis]
MLSAPVPPTVVGAVLVTSGAEQVIVTRCPGCGAAHRHLALGLRTPVCGRPYIVELHQVAAPRAVA